MWAEDNDESVEGRLDTTRRQKSPSRSLVGKVEQMVELTRYNRDS